VNRVSMKMKAAKIQPLIEAVSAQLSK